MRSGPTFLSTSTCLTHRTSRCAQDCWQAGFPPVGCAIVLPSVYIIYQDAGEKYIRRPMGFQMQGRRQPRYGAFRRLLGCMAVGSWWYIDKFHVAGVAHLIVDGILRWNSKAIDGNRNAFGPDVAWHRKVLETVDVAICSGLLAANSSANTMRYRLAELMYYLS